MTAVGKVLVTDDSTALLLGLLRFSATKLWNTALWQARECWKTTGKIPSYAKMDVAMKQEHPLWYRRLHSQSAQAKGKDHQEYVQKIKYLEPETLPSAYPPAPQCNQISCQRCRRSRCLHDHRGGPYRHQRRQRLGRQREPKAPRMTVRQDHQDAHVQGQAQRHPRCQGTRGLHEPDMLSMRHNMQSQSCPSWPLCLQPMRSRDQR